MAHDGEDKFKLSEEKVNAISQFATGPIGSSAKWEALVVEVSQVIQHSVPLGQLLRQMLSKLDIVYPESEDPEADNNQDAVEYVLAAIALQFTDVAALMEAAFVELKRKAKIRGQMGLQEKFLKALPFQVSVGKPPNAQSGVHIDDLCVCSMHNEGTFCHQCGKKNPIEHTPDPYLPVICECGQSNSAHAKFCCACGLECGANCSKCTVKLIPGHAFCYQCGTATGVSLNAGVHTNQMQQQAQRLGASHVAPPGVSSALPSQVAALDVPQWALDVPPSMRDAEIQQEIQQLEQRLSAMRASPSLGSRGGTKGDKAKATIRPPLVWDEQNEVLLDRVKPLHNPHVLPKTWTPKYTLVSWKVPQQVPTGDRAVIRMLKQCIGYMYDLADSPDKKGIITIPTGETPWQALDNFQKPLALLEMQLNLYHKVYTYHMSWRDAKLASSVGAEVDSMEEQKEMAAFLAARHKVEHQLSHQGQKPTAYPAKPPPKASAKTTTEDAQRAFVTRVDQLEAAMNKRLGQEAGQQHGGEGGRRGGPKPPGKW